ncbi:hypothetical protein B0I35DRAFT_98554 [Stachybotrys elegans]|uniref:Uncharacterized protein n=1 Tax=Stachybotrys elegans TaxID=80388 RepID=A0A8K0SHW3_9HYPO|nr:hypothetical protein B0I35DRAFT_98554 [Stachybotrys elegans]
MQALCPSPSAWRKSNHATLVISKLLLYLAPSVLAPGLLLGVSRQNLRHDRHESLLKTRVRIKLGRQIKTGPQTARLESPHRHAIRILSQKYAWLASSLALVLCFSYSLSTAGARKQSQQLLCLILSFTYSFSGVTETPRVVNPRLL